jgi:hypothetical protein
MPTQPLPLPMTFQTVVLDTNGNGTAQIGPTRPREHWQATGISVKTSSNTKEAQCAVYFGLTVSDATFIDQTATGSTGDTCGINIDAQAGQLFFAKWTGGDAGATGIMNIYGTYTIGAPT